MPFQRERLIGLCKAKGIRTPEELEAICGIAGSTLAEFENGSKTPDPDTLETLAIALDATMDYFHGIGEHFDDNRKGYAQAAIHLSFNCFNRNPTISSAQKERCQRVLRHPGAPRTFKAWKALAEMIDL